MEAAQLGFRQEGHFIKDHYFKKDQDGEPIWADTYAHTILEEEWLK